MARGSHLVLASPLVDTEKGFFAFEWGEATTTRTYDATNRLTALYHDIT